MQPHTICGQKYPLFCPQDIGTQPKKISIYECRLSSYNMLIHFKNTPAKTFSTIKKNSKISLKETFPQSEANSSEPVPLHLPWHFHSKWSKMLLKWLILSQNNICCYQKQHLKDKMYTKRGLTPFKRFLESGCYIKYNAMFCQAYLFYFREYKSIIQKYHR